jgi:hypothetical protein
MSTLAPTIFIISHFWWGENVRKAKFVVEITQLLRALPP